MTGRHYLNDGMSVEDANSYHDHDGWVVTSSSLRDFLKSPTYYYNKYVSKVITPACTDAMSFGEAFHYAVLEPERFKEKYYSDPHRKNAKESKQIAQEYPDKERLSAKDYDLCVALSGVAWSHPIAQQECKAGQVEQVYAAKMRNGLLVKCKPDLINDDGIYDLKSMGRPLNMFTEHAFSLGYHIQAAFYTGVLYGLKDPIHRDFSFWVVTKRVPYQCVFFRVSWEECMNVWKEVCIPALNDIAHLMRSNEWGEDSRGCVEKRVHIPSKLMKYKYNNGERA